MLATNRDAGAEMECSDPSEDDMKKKIEEEDVRNVR